jgi:hypothetical protein
MSVRGRQDELEEVNLLDLTPVRVAEWEEVDGRVVLARPTKWRGGLKGVLDRFFYLLSARKIRLDDIGSFAWQQIDGEQTVAQIAEKLRDEFGERVEPAEGRLGHMVRVLRREGLVTYPGWDDGGR